jgi:hypothetical protein
MIARWSLPWILLYFLVGVVEGGEVAHVRIGDRAVITVEVARTEEEKIRGLSGRDGLAPGRGMLFVYEAPVRSAMWMSGMRFPLDILWIRDGRIVAVVKGAKPPAPGELPQTFTPSEAVHYVLEVSAGFADRHDIALDDPVHVDLGGGGAE